VKARTRRHGSGQLAHRQTFDRIDEQATTD
jgi:hypothetical protein